MGNVNMEAKQIHDRTEAGKRQSVADHLKALDAVARQIENLPTFTSNDKAFLEGLPAFPSEDGSKVLTATTSGGNTNLSYGAIPKELPADPATDGTRVLTATTTSGETALSWEDPASGGLDYSTTEQNTGIKWIDGKDIYFKTFELTSLVVASNVWVDTGITSGAETVVGGFAIASAGGTFYPVNIAPDLSSTGHFGILQLRSVDITIGAFCAYYTKPTV